MSENIEKIIGPRVPAEEMQAHRARYLMPTLLFVAAAILLLISIFLPYWQLTLHAPQYPKGLSVQAYLNRLEGDVGEIDGLNHYIGMRPLDEAALRASISIIGVVVVALLILARRLRPQPLGGAARPAGAALPGDLPGRPAVSGWPTSARTWTRRAAVAAASSPSCRPCCSTGNIAQFSTSAAPAIGLWLAIAGLDADPGRSFLPSPRLQAAGGRPEGAHKRCLSQVSSPLESVTPSDLSDPYPMKRSGPIILLRVLHHTADCCAVGSAGTGV